MRPRPTHPIVPNPAAVAESPDMISSLVSRAGRAPDEKIKKCKGHAHRNGQSQQPPTMEIHHIPVNDLTQAGENCVQPPAGEIGTDYQDQRIDNLVEFLGLDFPNKPDAEQRRRNRKREKNA